MGFVAVKKIERTARQAPKKIEGKAGERKSDGMVLVDAKQAEETMM